MQEHSCSVTKLKNIIAELDHLEEGALVVHCNHGIAKFMGMETISVVGTAHDCLKLLYADNDRLYVPVENIGLVKKYGHFDAELDKLGLGSWQKRKAKIKEYITDTANELLSIAAKRKSAKCIVTEYTAENFDNFCKDFEYIETEDQINAINDIKSDLTSGLLMDRLICGDVGFGKTEVAMRASYMIVADTNSQLPQVVIVVPTTILCAQHYTRFALRFKKHGFNIVQLSRLMTTKEIKIIHDKIESGEANIIIATHAVFCKNIKFYNLKMVIIDEEQHFGVKQKEYLKQLRSDIHILSLSATPIPRTLQMSMTGIKDLSIIATPPVDRLPVHTTIMQFDQVTIRDALLKEHARGGKSFYVVPRIHDIQDIETQLKEITPELKYKVAHGKINATTVDKIMQEFYANNFDILVSTSIIESGTDIPNANTLIVHKANMFGLSQLYQLKGRIGRSNTQGFAYFVLDNKKITEHSVKRLNIIQNTSSLGGGFMIATHDMDLRGFGNLLGQEQSGRIKEVGIELYQEMLEEQIAKLNDETVNSINDFIPSINLSLPVFIPNHYISDSGLKLAMYKRIGNLRTAEEIDEFYQEMTDRFGDIPPEVLNLLGIIKIKQVCIRLKIENLDSGPKGFVLKFSKDADIADMVMKFINTYPKNSKLKPDNKLIFVQNIEQAKIIEQANSLLEQLAKSA